MTVHLIGATTDAVLDSIVAHFGSLGLDDTQLEAAKAALATANGTTAHANLLLDASNRLVAFGHLNEPEGAIVNLSVEGVDGELWEQRLAAPLASGETTVINATRGDLTVPAVDGVAIVAPKSRRFGISLAPRDEDAPAEAPDFPEPDDWEQLTPGVPTEYPFSPNGYPLGWTVIHNDVRYLQEGDLPTGNFFVPGTVGSLWRAVTGGEGYDPWDAGTTYAAGDRVTDEGEDWLNRDASNTGRKPGSTAAGWLRISNRPYPYYYLGNAGYPLTVDDEPMQVTDAGRLWQVTQNGAGGSSFPPSVVGTGWQDVGPAP